MKFKITILFIFLIVNHLFSQQNDVIEEGTISFVTTQNVYVKFKSTKHINIGDTLYFNNDKGIIPILLVKNKSSVSCVCSPITDMEFRVNDQVFSKTNIFNPIQVKENKLEVEFEKDTVEVVSENIQSNKLKPDIGGNISITSYSNSSKNESQNYHRMRYNVSLFSNNILGSKFSGDSYISFKHKTGNWDEVKQNLNSALKIYKLAFNYKINSETTLSFGRKYNRIVSGIGAIDGLQFEKKEKQITYGAILGSKPDFVDYRYNISLFQFGAYLSHKLDKEKVNIQSSIGLFEQLNGWKTDRRFVYFQQNSSLFKTVNVFYSCELDLYENVDSLEINIPRLSNFYISTRYRIFKKLTLSASYNARNNIIYYETYKSYIDQLIDKELRQGYRFQINYRPFKYVSIGLRTGYRFQKSDLKASQNMHGYISYRNIPFVNLSTTISMTKLNTSYLEGNLYGITFSKDVYKGKIYTSLSLKYVDYNFVNSEIPLMQNEANLNCSWRLSRDISFSANYEGIFEENNSYSRFYLQLRKRF